ncbi:hypothetical protein AB0C28_36640 [Nonomuraea sp. NPDC048892]|uniref:hypothetical protein n=1 Tax=Nonomuraea sp. NPDC048892 TaxID=3154624 RepID=UPI0033EEBB62
MALALLGTEPVSWTGSWPETGAATQASAFYLSVLAAGAAAWVSSSNTRHGLIELTASATIPSAAVEAYRLAAAAALLLVPYLIGGAAGFALTASTFPPGLGLWAGYVLMGAIVMLLAVAWGWAIGRYANPAYAALTASLSWFVFEAFPGDAADLGVASGPAWKQPDPLALLLRSAAVMAFLSLIAWAYTKNRKRWKSLTLTVLGGTGAVLVTMSTTGVSDRHVPDHPLCVSGAIEICLWPEDRKYLPLVRALDQRAATLPTDWRLPAHLDQYGLKRIERNDNGERAVELDGAFKFPDGSKWGLALGMSHAILNRTLGPCDWKAIWKAEDFTPETLRKWLEFYLAESNRPAYRTTQLSEDMGKAWSSASQAFGELPADQQFDWARRQLDRVKDSYCAHPSPRP